MIFGSSSIFIIFIAAIQTAYTSSLEHDGSLFVKLEHYLDENNEPVERGNISVQSIRIGQTQVYQNILNPQQSQMLRNLASSNSFYQIRAIANGKPYISSVKACMLAEAELDDRLSISLDYAGRVVAVSQIIASKSSCEGATVPLDKLKYFTTNVYVRHAEMGPIPDTASYIQRIEREREAKERGEGKDNRSLFAKYWMYIIPVVVVLVISSATNVENGGAGAAN
ncbi:ER membrane protein complex subunit 10 [Coccinella septempunctata]|uniref:ER membrane protein complex subunit 10 n=1 Tax=Coccinella septempunctata TaxID=41139 RepID=UPI001D063E01|nr:ER membrane protein complex subunit 10 [Coccinella septempunctata]